MAGYRRFRRNYRRRRRRRFGYAAAKRTRLRRYYKYSRIKRLVRPFENVRTVKLKYVRQVEANLRTDLGCVGAAIRANSVFNPDGDHQPYVYDQWTALYKRYCVLGSKVVCKLYNTTESPMTLYVALKDSADMNTDPDLHVEQGKVRYKCVPINECRTVSYKFSANRFFATRVFNNKDEYAGYNGNTQILGGTDPAKVAWFQLMVSRNAPDGAAGQLPANSVIVFYEITYIVKLFDPRMFGQS